MTNDSSKIFGIPLTPELLLKVVALVFAAGMLYANIKSSGEETRLQIQSMKEQVSAHSAAQEKRMDRIEDYLEAMRRNKL